MAAVSQVSNPSVVEASQLSIKVASRVDEQGRTSASDIEKQSHEEDEDGKFHQVILKDGQEVLVTWTREEERRVVRKADFLFLPLFTLMFTWMAIDRTNVSGVLTSTFLHDTRMTRDQANTGVSLLWFGIVLLEIPSNVVLHRIGAHYWIPFQVLLWGLIEVLQMFVKNASGWYAARLFLGLAESGFIPGGLYTLSRWYTKDELTKRTTVFFFGPSISAAFGSLISAGSLRLEGQHGLFGWQWIFLICGISTIATGVIALLFLPKSPYHTNRLLAGLIPTRGWLSDREADVFLARIVKANPTTQQSDTMNITLTDIKSVLLDWKVYPYLIACLSGLQSTNGLSTWGGVIIKSLGFTSIRANLLNSPAPISAALLGLALAWQVDKYKRFGYAILFVGIWTLAGLIALYNLPVTTKGSWSFYAAYFMTVASPGWQPINVTWLSLNMATPQRRAIAYAVYIGCSNLGGTYGNQVFRASDAPRYRKAWTACISLGVVWIVTIASQTTTFQLLNRKWAKKHAGDSGEEKDGDIEKKALYTDKRGKKHLYFW